MKNFKKVLIICLLMIIMFGCHKHNGDPIIESNEHANPIETFDTISYEKEIAEVNKYIDINDDFIGLLNLGEGIVENEIIVKDLDNNEYIRKDFYTKEYSLYGTTFMDYRNTPDFKTSKNIIFYGHYIYPEYRDGAHLNFTKLSELIDKDKYEDNKNASLLTKDGIRKYTVAKIFYINENDIAKDIGPLYYITDFTEDEFSNYLNEVKNVEFYDTGVELKYDDKLLTLVTCVENRSELRLIIVLKEINRIDFKK